MELKLFSILQPQLMVSLNLFGESKPETQLLPITTSALALTELELKFSRTNSQVETVRKLIMTLAISMEALMLQLLTVAEHLL